jgi:hypothetical protein
LLAEFDKRKGQMNCNIEGSRTMIKYIKYTYIFLKHENIKSSKIIILYEIEINVLMIIIHNSNMRKYIYFRSIEEKIVE